MPPAAGPRVVDGHAVAEEREVVRAGEAGGAGADDRDLAPGRLELALAAPARPSSSKRSDSSTWSAMSAVHVAHVDGLVHRGAAAAVVAGVLADAAGGGRQRVVEDHREEGVLEPALLVELQEARDVHVQRAGVLAGRERQVLAHAGAAALGPDVVLELVAEVPQGGEHRVRRALAEAAQRRVADHAAQLVERLEVLAAVAVPCVKRFRMRSALSRPTRQGTHLPQLSECVNSMK